MSDLSFSNMYESCVHDQLNEYAAMAFLLYVWSECRIYIPGSVQMNMELQ